MVINKVNQSSPQFSGVNIAKNLNAVSFQKNNEKDRINSSIKQQLAQQWRAEPARICLAMVSRLLTVREVDRAVKMSEHQLGLMKQKEHGSPSQKAFLETWLLVWRQGLELEF
ncbi:MAG: hypothetical protein MZU95_04520 [Desulfomicrobium escambiense]|nr:hypothetical protein [Desulfomicrobium escambiense]